MPPDSIATNDKAPGSSGGRAGLNVPLITPHREPKSFQPRNCIAFPPHIGYNPSEFGHEDSTSFSTGQAMNSPWNASFKLVLRAGLLGLLTGCATVTSTNSPQPVSPGASSNGVSVAPGGLQLGYIWHADRGNLYPILGVSGAAHYGSPAPVSGPPIIAAAAATSASSSWALMLHKDGTLDEWSAPAPGVGTLAAAVAPDSRILFSPSGTCAALVSPSASTAVVMTGLPSKPLVANLSLPAGFAPNQIAVGNDGSILAGVTRPGAGGIQLGILSETHGYTPIGAVQAWGGASFLPSSAGDAAVFADGATARLTYASNLNGASPVLAPLADAGLLQRPVAVTVSPDGKWAYVADSAKPQIVRLNIGASVPAPSSITCACTPQQLVPLTTDGVYSLSSDVQGQPAWLLDTRTPQPRTFFVPALPVSVAGQAGDTRVKQGSGAAQ